MTSARIPSRRSLALPVALLILGCAVSTGQAGATRLKVRSTEQASEKERLNILVLTIDDMNCDSVGAFGCSTPDTTPNMDRFAAESLRFMHAHVLTSSCIPSRNAVQTGRYLYNSGIEGFYQVPRDQVNYKTTPEVLRENGYFTMIRGKSYHTSPYEPFPAWDINFDREVKKKTNVRDAKSFYGHTKRAVAAAKASGKPFYYALDIHDPHTPFYSFSYKKGVVSGTLARDDIHNRPSRIFAPDEITMPGFLADTPLTRREVTAYYNSVRRADDAFGNVIRALKDTGVFDRTLIVFFSDHGMPFPFAKTSMYYHSTHTPLMVRWPGVTREGAQDVEHLIGTVDIFPTLLDVAEIETPRGLDGRSFASILRGTSQADRDFTYVMYEENAGGHRQPTRAVLSKEYSYICNLWSDGERVFETVTNGMASTAEMKRLAEEGDEYMHQRDELYTYGVPEQFFDLARDPDALNNLIANPEYEALIETFRDRMVETMESSSDPMLDIYRKRDDEAAVAGYLARLDSESTDRMTRAEYSRSGKAKSSKPESGELPQETGEE